MDETEDVVEDSPKRRANKPAAASAGQSQFVVAIFAGNFARAGDLELDRLPELALHRLAKANGVLEVLQHLAL